jgi:hypothetical protein
MSTVRCASPAEIQWSFKKWPTHSFSQHTHSFGSANLLPACPCLCHQVQCDPQLEVPEVVPSIHGNHQLCSSSKSQSVEFMLYASMPGVIQASPRPHMGHLLHLIVVCFFVAAFVLHDPTPPNQPTEKTKEF